MASRRTLTALFATALACPGTAQAWPHKKVGRSDAAGAVQPAVSKPDVTTALPRTVPGPQPGKTPPAVPLQAQPPPIAKPPPPPTAAATRRFGRFDLDMPFAQLRALTDLGACKAALAAPSGHADCALPRDADKLERAQIAWQESRNGPEVIALRLQFDPQLAPALTDLEWQLSRWWGPPTLEQLRRDKDQKFFTLQWEDPEHRATLEAQGPVTQPSRAVAVVLERKPAALAGEFVGLHPRPFPGFRVRWIRRVEWEGQLHALLWGTSLSPAQEALGESAPSWATQRNYVGLWKLEPATALRPRRWKPLWERSTGGEDEDEPQRVLFVDIRDVTNDGAPDVEVELSCESCGPTANELIVKTVRAGKLVDLLSKRDLYHARVELMPNQIRIREPEGEDDRGVTVSTYAYDRGKGTFVLAREERAPAPDR